MSFAAKTRAKTSNHLYLWPGRAVYVGVGYDGTQHAHLASEFGVNLEGELEVGSDTSPPNAYSNFLVTPNVPHRVNAAGVRGVFAWSESFALSNRLGTGLTGLVPAKARALADETLDDSTLWTRSG